MAPLSTLFTLLSLLRRQNHAPYITVQTEQTAPCRTYPDMLGDYPYLFGAGTNLNVTCWTDSSMLNDEKGHPGSDTSFTWLWIKSSGTWSAPLGAPGVGNADKGGKASGDGCWLHENDVANAGDIYFPDQVDWCGAAPHHQVGTPNGFNVPFICRNCTDLSNAACQSTSNTTNYGFTDVGCWKKGTAVNGNSTWVTLLQPPSCYISPDQFDPKGWHGPPAGQCA